MSRSENMRGKLQLIRKLCPGVQCVSVCLHTCNKILLFIYVLVYHIAREITVKIMQQK